MKTYSIFTNIYNHNPNKSVPQNFNRFKVLHANTIEQVKAIKNELAKQGFTVTKVTTNLGTLVRI